MLARSLITVLALLAGSTSAHSHGKLDELLQAHRDMQGRMDRMVESHEAQTTALNAEIRSLRQEVESMKEEKPAVSRNRHGLKDLMSTGRHLLSTSSENISVQIDSSGVTASQVEASDDIVLGDVSLTSYFSGVDYLESILEDYFKAEDVDFYMQAFFGFDLSSNATNLISFAVDGSNGFTALAAVTAMTTVEIENTTYLIATGQGGDDGIQGIDLSDPYNPTASFAIFDEVGDFNDIAKPRSISTGYIEGVPYMFIGAFQDDAVTIANLSDPTNPMLVATAVDGSNGFTNLNGIQDVEFHKVNGVPYLFTVARADDALEIINVSDPSNPSQVATETDGSNGFDGLGSASACKVETRDDGTVVMYVLGATSDAVQVVDVSDPTSPVAGGSVFDDVGACSTLAGVSDLGLFSQTNDYGNKEYFLLVTATTDDGFQIINVTDINNPSCIGSGSDEDGTFSRLDGTRAVTTFTLTNLVTGDDVNFAILATTNDASVIVIDLSDPSTPTPAETFTNNKNNRQALTFKQDGITYLAIESQLSNEVLFYTLTG